MYAIIQKGTKQLSIEKGAIYKIDKVLGEPGDEISFKEVLLVVDGETSHIGTPFVKDAEVVGKIIKDVKGKKVYSFKFRRRKSSKVKKGHRQQYTLLQIEDIKV